MEALLQYFETIPSAHRSLLLVGGITLFWFLEGALPLFKFKYKKWKHAWPNLFFTLTTVIINFVLAFLLLKTADWVTVNNFGLINWLPEMPLWLYAILGVLLLDFIGAYLAHYVEHKVKPLWKIHLVHHTDHNVDTTTANRHHPLESIIRFAFTLLGVVSGSSVGTTESPLSAGGMDASLERASIVHKVRWCVVPLLYLLHFHIMCFPAY